MSETWKSPRKVDEEIRQYKHERFEKYMQMADDEVLTRALAIAAFTEEINDIIWTPEGKIDDRATA